MLMRADAGRLPFKSGSLAAIHAGAAMHCWPNPTAAVRTSQIHLHRQHAVLNVNGGTALSYEMLWHQHCS